MFLGMENQLRPFTDTSEILKWANWPFFNNLETLDLFEILFFENHNNLL